MTKRKKEEDGRIVLAKLSLSLSLEKIDKLRRGNRDLSEAIKEAEEKRKKEGKDIFYQKDNILVTEDAYYVALYASDLEKING